MNLFKKLGPWLKSLFGKKPKELPAPPPQEDISLTEALEALAKLAEQFVVASSETAPLEDYHSGDRPDNKRLALRLAAGDPVGCLQRIIEPSEDIIDEWAALRKNYGTRVFEKLAHTADPNELDRLVKEADEAKLIRAQKAAARMSKLDLISKSKVAINNQVKEIMEWSDAALEEMEHRLHTREKWLSNEPTPSTKKKPAPRKPKKETSKSKEVRLSPKRKTKLNLTHSGYFDDTRDRPKGKRK
jgi:hypothetical protein